MSGFGGLAETLHSSVIFQQLNNLLRTDKLKTL